MSGEGVVCKRRNPRHLQGRRDLSWEPKLGEDSSALNRPVSCWRSAHSGPRGQPRHGHSYVTSLLNPTRCLLPSPQETHDYLQMWNTVLGDWFPASGPLPWWGEIHFSNPSAIKHWLHSSLTALRILDKD